MVELIIYSRQDCHLCHEMERDLARLTREHPVSVRVVDVDTDPQLQSRYGLRVPVLVAGEEEVCATRLDPDRVRTLLRAPD
jgi:thioredoxin reductase (NADPH)